MKKIRENTHTFLVTIKQSLIRERIMCPIIIFAVSRKPRVIGRTEVLKNSIIEMNGASHRGVPRGRNWPKNLDNLNVILEIITASQVIQAALKEKIVWTVVGKKYGFILIIFKNKIEKNKVKIKGKENFKKIFLEFLSCPSQTNSNCDIIFFLTLVLKKEADIEGIRNNANRIIPVGKK